MRVPAVVARPAGMQRFAEACAAIARTAATGAKVGLLADYLRELDDADLEAAARFFTGKPFAASDQRTLSLGSATIVAAAKEVWAFSDQALRTAWREHGDLGAALAELVRPPLDLGLFAEPLTPASLRVLFEEIADAGGKAAGKRRLVACERILAACGSQLEATYVVKVMTGDLRIGLREGLVVSAIAAAAGADEDEVRRAVMASGDVGSVAVAARHGGLRDVRIAYGAPIGFMLASPIEYGGAYRELAEGDWLIEDKFDGIRLQAHKDGDAVRLFSRTLNDVSHSYPEVVAAVARLEGRFVLDGELVARRDGAVLPFRALQARLQRKDVTDELLAGVPVAFMAFDLVACGEAFLLDEPLRERRRLLEDLLSDADAGVLLARQATLDAADVSAQVQARFEDARARGHEGLLLKRADAPYRPGRRGKWWLKVKAALTTIDVVVVAVEWGHGKRAKVLSDYTFAVRGADGELLPIGKAFTGLTDAEIARLTPWFLAHETGRLGHAIAVEPEIVLEVAFDVVQPSSLHASGYSLRFPRIVRVRDDKPVAEIDTLENVEAIYRKMLERENGNS